MKKNTYHWCEWHKSWVEHNPEGKGPDSSRLRKKLYEEHKTRSQGYAQALKTILTYLNEEE